MRHRKAGVKLNRTSSHRDAMFRNMVTSLFKHEKIKTTDAKAKELRRWADKLITLAKRGDLHARRQAMSIIREKAVVHKLFEEAPKKFGAVAGGYTRVVKLGLRSGDAAPISLVEFVVPEEKPKKKKAAKKKTAAAKTAAKTAKKKAAKKEKAPAEKAEAADEATAEAEEEAQAAEEAPPEEEAAAEADGAPEEKEAASDTDEAASEPAEDAVPEESEPEKKDEK